MTSVADLLNFLMKSHRDSSSLLPLLRRVPCFIKIIDLPLRFQINSIYDNCFKICSMGFWALSGLIWALKGFNWALSGLIWALSELNWAWGTLWKIIENWENIP